MSFDISLSPLEAAVPQNEVYRRRCWLAPRSKKMRLQGEADFCQGHFCQILVDGRPGSWFFARRPLLVLPRSLTSWRAPPGQLEE